MHRQTGEIVWRIHRPEADSFGTPVVAHIAGRDQLLMAGRDAICAYDPQTGDSLWTCRWPADRVANSVAFDDQHVYASTRMPNPELLCIRADGDGDVTNSHVVWRTNKSSGEYPSPVVFEGKLYMQGDDGVLSCLDPGNGQPVWKRLLRGTMSTSPVIAGQHLYCCNEEGTVFVIRLGGRGELVAEVSMNEAIYASPVVSRNRLFLRTRSSLHCIAPIEDIPIVIQPDPPRRRF
jgi:outer membrane protein assembly factor BamB